MYLIGESLNVISRKIGRAFKELARQRFRDSIAPHEGDVWGPNGIGVAADDEFRLRAEHIAKLILFDEHS